jgi:hypothetical protein
MGGGFPCCYRAHTRTRGVCYSYGEHMPVPHTQRDLNYERTETQGLETVPFWSSYGSNSRDGHEFLFENGFLITIFA